MVQSGSRPATGSQVTDHNHGASPRNALAPLSKKTHDAAGPRARSPISPVDEEFAQFGLGRAGGSSSPAIVKKPHTSPETTRPSMTSVYSTSVIPQRRSHLKVATGRKSTKSTTSGRRKLRPLGSPSRHPLQSPQSPTRGRLGLAQSLRAKTRAAQPSKPKRKKKTRKGTKRRIKNVTKRSAGPSSVASALSNYGRSIHSNSTANDGAPQHSLTIDSNEGPEPPEDAASNNETLYGGMEETDFMLALEQEIARVCN